MRSKKQKVVVAMSGGVDSSVAAALLKQQGYDLIGVFMKFWTEPQISTDRKNRYENRCCSTEAENRARKVAEILNIPFYVFNFEKEFKKKIVDYFLAEYKKGRTPNPCVFCNKEIKFGVLLERALALKADFVATGHYARLRREIPSTKSQISNKFQAPNPKSKLFKAKDRTRDQSYFLWQMNQRQLKHILFPLGDLTKREVRNLAKKLDLPVSDIPESREICFVTKNVNDFLSRHLRQKPGKIINTQGKIIGPHYGLAFYTIGQRKGLRISGGPYWVLNKNLKENLLTVTRNEKDLYSKELIVEKVNWISGKEPKLPVRVKAKIRYEHKAAAANLTKKLQAIRLPAPDAAGYGGQASYKLTFEEDQKAVTSGQSVVFYSSAKTLAKTDKEELLGGGIIK